MELKWVTNVSFRGQSTTQSVKIVQQTQKFNKCKCKRNCCSHLQVQIEEQNEGNENEDDHVHPENVDPDVDPVGPELGGQDGQLHQWNAVVVGDESNVVATLK